MPQPTECSVDGCTCGVYLKTLCAMHYSRARRGRPVWRTCEQCGVLIEGSPANNTWCSIECKPRCSVEGCEEPTRKREWCGKHYTRWRINGSPFDEDQAWVIGPVGLPCEYCGAVERHVKGLRRYCSWACATTAAAGRPKYRECVSCGEAVNLAERVNGRFRRADRAHCDSCKRVSHLDRFIPDLIARDGGDCQLCGDPVDLGIKAPHPMSQSVDHIIAWSRGGPDALDNYQLAHLRCNVAKGSKSAS